MALNPKSKLTVECGTNPLTVILERVHVCITDTHNKETCQLYVECCFGGTKWGLEGRANNYCHA